MKLLIVTNLFPNAAEPNRAIFNLQQYTALSRICELKIVSPVPLFKYSKNRVPDLEKINGIDVFHPRHIVIPKILRFTYGYLFFLGIWQTLVTIRQCFKYDLILATWGYPDAFGTAIAAKLLRKKFFVKVQGSDINLAHQYWLRKPMIKWAVKRAEKVIAVSLPLKQKMIMMGVPEEKIVVIQNGVDTKKFYPRDKAVCREKLGLDKTARYVLYVGNFAAVKGVSYLIKAFALLVKDMNIKLLLIGDGEERAALIELAHSLGMSDRIVFVGRKPHQEVPEWMSAVDVFCLPSLNEGCPNVILEALACGAKVVATNVGGIPDLIDTPEKGWLAKSKDPEDLARCLEAALKAPVVTHAVATMSWDENAAMLYKVISKVPCAPNLDMPLV
ncbi:MAG: glycosyltransferase family 4 protein [Candidatus Omnitrophica bacterium]|nr:glycosyltransferase family 4 protein [Candidatus Omnitrophota bacterium]